MKTLIAISLAAILASAGCRSSRPKTVDPEPVKVQESSDAEKYKIYSDPTTWLLGNFTLSRLSQPPHADWYIKGMDEYTVNQVLISKLKEIAYPGVTIKIVLGTWCPDSRREVPRFMKILDALKFPPDNVQFIGVDNMKIAPVENYEELDIQRVPTFIIYKNKIESGRIIENPVTSLEQDMADILTRNEK